MPTRSMLTDRNRYWFRQRSFGLGAAPNTWQGWILTALFIGFVIGMGYWATKTEPSLYWSGTFIVVTSLFTFFVWKKTEGGWQWRWGNGPDSNSHKDE